jgi:hypothetical protein
MELLITTGGDVQCLYDEAVDLAALGETTITRASHVEPDEAGQWWADCSPLLGPKLGPFARRSDALSAEAHWLREHRLFPH